jgi:hypothetical protein
LALHFLFVYLGAHFAKAPGTRSTPRLAAAKPGIERIAIHQARTEAAGVFDSACLR